jgi:hypothetical protein
VRSDLPDESVIGYSVKDLIVFLTLLRVATAGSSCQHLRDWRNVDTHPQLPQDSFRGKALPSLEIDTLATWNPECSMRDFENGKVIRSSLRRG